MSTDCVIEFDNNPSGVFLSGQVLSGTVVLVTRKPKSINSIFITVKGHAFTRWSEGTDDDNYHGKDEYLDSQTYVLRSEDGDVMDLAVGTHSYKFHIALPEQLPSSIEGSCGCVRYKVKVTIDRPWRFNNVFKRPFQVVHLLDLNRNYQFRLPTVFRVDKTFSSIFCHSGVLRATLSLPFSGYAVGQRISFVFNVENRSSVGCGYVGVKLVQDLEFSSDPPISRSRQLSKKIAEVYVGSVPKFETKEFRDSLKVPHVPPNSNGSCRLIEITYSLHGILRTDGCHRNLKMSTPLVIGTCRLRITEARYAVDPIDMRLSYYRKREDILP